MFIKCYNKFTKSVQIRNSHFDISLNKLILMFQNFKSQLIIVGMWLITIPQKLENSSFIPPDTIMS